MIFLIRNTCLFLLLISFAYSGVAQNTLDIAVAGGISMQLADKSTLNGRLVEGEDPGFAYRIGASYSVKIASRTHICIGGNYTSLATTRTFDPTDLRWGTQWNGTAFDPTISSGEDFSKTINVSRVSDFEAPIIIRRYLGSTERVYVLAALVPALHVRYVNVIKQEGEDRLSVENTSTDFESFQLATSVGVGTDWPLTEKIKLFRKRLTSSLIIILKLKVLVPKIGQMGLLVVQSRNSLLRQIGDPQRNEASLSRRTPTLLLMKGSMHTTRISVRSRIGQAHEVLRRTKRLMESTQRILIAMLKGENYGHVLTVVILPQVD